MTKIIADYDLFVHSIEVVLRLGVLSVFMPVFSFFIYDTFAFFHLTSHLTLKMCILYETSTQIRQDSNILKDFLCAYICDT